MKKEMILPIVLIFTLCVAFASAQNFNNPSDIQDINVSLVNQEPDPAEPSDVIEVRVRFDNFGGDSARDFEAQILPEYPFSLPAGDDGVRSAGSIGGRQFGTDGLILRYKLLVADDAVEADHELELQYRVSGGAWIRPDPLLINVQTNDAILSIDSISTSRSNFEPGSLNTVRLTLENNADNSLKDIRATLELAGTPFVPVGTSNEYNLFSIGKNDKETISFSLYTDPEAAAGIYSVPIELNYADNLNRNYFKNQTIGFVVGAAPEIDVVLDDTEIFQSGSKGDVNIKVVNRGVTDVKFMNIVLAPSDAYTTITNNNIYLGNIDSDDFETADFTIFVKSTDASAVMLPVTITYKDALNEDFETTVEIPLQLFSDADAKKFGLVEQGGGFGMILFIIIIIAGVWFYRRWKKKKKTA